MSGIAHILFEHRRMVIRATVRERLKRNREPRHGFLSWSGWFTADVQFNRMEQYHSDRINMMILAHLPMAGNA